MFFRLFFLFAVLAVAFADPKPEPKPQFVTAYTAPVAPVAYGYGVPLAYSAAYSAYPYYTAPGYFVR